MRDEEKIKEKYGKDYTYEKWYSIEIDLEHLPKNKAVVFGDGETYCWMLTKKDKKSVPAGTLSMPKIAEEKLVLQWKESKLIGGEPVYYLDESHAVCIKNYIDQIELWFFERTLEDGKYYCRVTKTHVLDAKSIKENYEILLNA